MEAEIRRQLRHFIAENYLFGDTARIPDDAQSLLGTGVLDSTGVLELIEYLEEQFGINVEDSETVPSNLDSIGALARFVAAKRRASDAA